MGLTYYDVLAGPSSFCLNRDTLAPAADQASEETSAFDNHNADMRGDVHPLRWSIFRRPAGRVVFRAVSI